MNIKVCHASVEPQRSQGAPDEYGLLPMVHHVFQEVNQATVIFMDEGSNTSLISKTLVNSLFMKGKVKLTSVVKACERFGESQPMIHHDLELKDRYGKKHVINCIEVEYITKPQEQVTRTSYTRSSPTCQEAP